MPDGVSVQITGKRGLSNLSMKETLSRWENEVGPAVIAEIRRRAPVGNDPGAGRLRDSISMRKGGGRGPLSVSFVSSAPYAKFVEDGTVPHKIEPRQASALHWTTNGGDVFARYVNHPGTKANPFVKQAVDAMMPYMRQALRKGVEKEFTP